jgi:ComF family protein
MQRLCSACREAHAAPRERCARCALPLPTLVPRCAACEREPVPFAAAIAAVDYVFPWADVVADFKQHQALDHAQLFAQMIVQAAQREHREVDLVVPMPTSATRLRERGFNPAWELTRRVARALHIDTRTGVLQRLIDTPPQRGLDREQRRANVRGAFSVVPHEAWRLQGKRIALVDDVMTTCATAAEATRVMLAAGARSVDVWVLARTPDVDDARVATA